MPSPSDLADLIRAKTGYPVASGNDRNYTALENNLQYDVALQRILRQWATGQGIPKRSAEAAKPPTLAKAYTFPSYLVKWRSAVNPAWDALGLGDEQEAEPAAEPRAEATAPGLSESMVRRIAQEVAQALDSNNELTISQNALALAEEAAQTALRSIPALVAKALESALPPRTIEVRDVATGAVRPLGLQHSKFPDLLRAATARDHKGHHLNIWLTGPTGSGKTSAAQAVATALGLPFGSDGSLDADYKVLGFRDANGNIVSTSFLSIYEHGGIYVADEIDNWLPSALLSLNAALANGFVNTPGGLITRHPDCCIIACANTWGLGATNEYVGRAKQDAATLDRFQPKIHWPLDEALERAIAEGQGGALGLVWHRAIVAARRAVANQGLKVIISPRATISGISLLTAGFPFEHVIDMTIAAGLSPEQQDSIVRAINHSGATAAYEALRAEQATAPSTLVEA